MNGLPVNGLVLFSVVEFFFPTADVLKGYHALTKAMHAAAFSAENTPVRVASLASGIIPARFKR